MAGPMTQTIASRNEETSMLAFRLLPIALFSLMLTAVPAAAGTITMIHHFKGSGDGAHPVSDLLVAGSLLYGTTQAGGSHWSGIGVDATGGTLFRFNPATGKVAILHSFGASGDGALPAPESLVKIGSKLYGTTMLGGSSAAGTIFSYDLTTHIEKVEYSFGNVPDGQQPIAGLVNVGGILYGTTSIGGSTGVGGTIFKFDPATGHESVVFSFNPVLGAWVPKAGLLPIAGVLYGTTTAGGTGGTIFKYTPSTNQFAVLHTFAGGNSDGRLPQAKLINIGGRLFGTTGIGGKQSSGTLFRFTLATGKLAVLHSFGPLPDGLTPSARLFNVAGKLYGTASQGGVSGQGVVFTYDTTTSSYAVGDSFLPTEGAIPLSGLTPFNGLFYGLADAGGPTAPSYGTLYSYTP